MPNWFSKCLKERSGPIWSCLVRFFGPDLGLDRIQRAETRDFGSWLRQAALSDASARKHARHCKRIFAVAVEEESLPANPFVKIKSISVAADRSDSYIDLKTIEKLLDELPDVRWRALASLARLAGLRAPSETHALTRGDIAFDAARMTVRASKTNSTRIVLIQTRLMSILLEAHELADSGKDRVVGLSKNNLHRTVKATLSRIDVTPWNDLFQQLRRDCETDWSMIAPAHATAEWLGHSENVSRKFYLQTTDSMFDLVTSETRAEFVQSPSVKASQEAASDHDAEVAESSQTPVFPE